MNALTTNVTGLQADVNAGLLDCKSDVTDLTTELNSLKGLVHELNDKLAELLATTATTITTAAPSCEPYVVDNLGSVADLGWALTEDPEGVVNYHKFGAVQLRNGDVFGSSFVSHTLQAPPGRTVEVTATMQARYLNSAASCVFAVSADGGATHTTVLTLTEAHNSNDRGGHVASPPTVITVPASGEIEMRMTNNGHGRDACLLLAASVLCE
jgi:hypothetical protein